MRGNQIGFGSDGSNVTPPATAGIFALALEVAEPPSIEQNHIRMAGGTGIDSRFETGQYRQRNRRRFGRHRDQGRRRRRFDCQQHHRSGRRKRDLVENADNEVRDNEVIGSGGAGIAVIAPLLGVPLTGNLIGGNTT